jgi:uncharacterized protein YcfL
MKYILITLALLLLAGCASPEEEGDLIGTMSVYKTKSGFMVMSDQTGEKMIFEFHLGRTIVLSKEP